MLKATVDVPRMGELNFCCTQLDHLDENWRMKQINAIIQSNDSPHILAGGVNSLQASDYSLERWNDIVKVRRKPSLISTTFSWITSILFYQFLDHTMSSWQYYEEIGKPTPRVEVMNFLKQKEYNDAKEFAGECESVVIIAKGQSMNLYLKISYEISPNITCNHCMCF